MYPVTLNGKGRRCLVVGGGWVALRKVEGLLAEGAQVTVVSPEAIGPLATFTKDQAITLEKRAYQPGEAAAFSLVFAATDDREVNRRVSEAAASAGGGVNARARGTTREETEPRYDLFFDATVDTRQIRARVPAAEELARWLSPDPEKPGSGHAENGKGSQAGVPSPDGARGRAGLVSLVGGGPGDAGLLTLRGRQRLMSAEAVVYDRLAAAARPLGPPAHVGRPLAG